MRSDEELHIKNEKITNRSRAHTLLYIGLTFEEFVGIKTTVKDLLSNKNLKTCDCII